MRSNKTVVRASVSKQGEQLEFAHPSLQDDAEIVFLAVTASGKALRSCVCVCVRERMCV